MSKLQFGRQLPLDLKITPDFSARSFIPSPCNQHAYDLMQHPTGWPNHCLAVIGPSGSGKTHLGHVFVDQAGAYRLSNADGIGDSADWRGHYVWLDDAGRADEMMLFTLINQAIAGELKGVLFTADHPPVDWAVSLPDLRSRLGALAVSRLGEADDELLAKIIEKLFKDKGLRVNDNVIAYLLTYADRSIDGLRALIDEIDQQAAIQKANVTRPFVANLLQKDLF